MRSLILKYAGECRTCGAILAVGDKAIYEKRVGVFCSPCAPTDPEAIRAVRQKAADRRADRYDEWAAKRETVANATIQTISNRYRGDHAFNTQPGHIPERARVIRREDRAIGSLSMAEKFRAKAGRLRHVRVAGDADRRRETVREAIRARLKVGMRVDTGIYGPGVVERINRKTATVSKTGTSGTFRTTVDLSFLRILEETA